MRAANDCVVVIISHTTMMGTARIINILVMNRVEYKNSCDNEASNPFN